VSEFEKRGNFTQNAIFSHFSTSHHFKPVRAPGFRLGLLAVWAFYFKDPTLEARASLLSERCTFHLLALSAENGKTKARCKKLWVKEGRGIFRDNAVILLTAA
jgi:hypothetical protein